MFVQVNLFCDSYEQTSKPVFVRNIRSSKPIFTNHVRASKPVCTNHVCSSKSVCAINVCLKLMSTIFYQIFIFH